MFFSPLFIKKKKYDDVLLKMIMTVGSNFLLINLAVAGKGIIGFKIITERFYS